MRENYKPATCHPDRRHAAKGLCFPCYVAQYPNTKRATCHPDRIAHCKGLCRVCYDRDLKAKNPEYAQAQQANFEKWRYANYDRKALYDQEYMQDERNKNRRRTNARLALLSKFGLTWEDEIRIIAEQGGVCAICGELPERQSFDLDHDHETGKFRGFLCGRCNKGLGLLGDSIEGLQRAIEYLQNV